LKGGRTQQKAKGTPHKKRAGLKRFLKGMGLFRCPKPGERRKGPISRRLNRGQHHRVRRFAWGHLKRVNEYTVRKKKKAAKKSGQNSVCHYAQVCFRRKKQNTEKGGGADGQVRRGVDKLQKRLFYKTGERGGRTSNSGCKRIESLPSERGGGRRRGGGRKNSESGRGTLPLKRSWGNQAPPPERHRKDRNAMRGNGAGQARRKSERIRWTRTRSTRIGVAARESSRDSGGTTQPPRPRGAAAVAVSIGQNAPQGAADLYARWKRAGKQPIDSAGGSANGSDGRVMGQIMGSKENLQDGGKKSCAHLPYAVDDLHRSRRAPATATYGKEGGSQFADGGSASESSKFQKHQLAGVLAERAWKESRETGRSVCIRGV